MGTAAGLSKETFDKLEKDKAVSLEALTALDMSDIELLGLPVGQRALLRVAINTLKGVKPETDVTQPLDIVTTKSLAADKDLNDLLEKMMGAHMSDILGNLASLLGNNNGPSHTGERPLLIPDFVTQCRYSQEDEEVLSSSVQIGGARLVLKQTKHKPAVDQVSAGQWTSANVSIILHQMNK